MNIASLPAPTKIKIGKLHRACSRTSNKGRKGQTILAVGNLCYPTQPRAQPEGQGVASAEVLPVVPGLFSETVNKESGTL